MGTRPQLAAILLGAFLFAPCITPAPAGAGQAAGGLTSLRLRENLWCISGAGGNIAVLAAEDGLLLVDSGLSHDSDAVGESLRRISHLPVAVLVRTHYHLDHTGGSAALGSGARLVAHRNLRESLLRRLGTDDAAAAGAAGETFEEEMRLPFGAETVLLRHFGPAHTAGDAVVVFPKAGVVHTGDLFFHGLVPFVDVRDGSDTGNWIAALRALAEAYPGFTVIPGHGPVTDVQELKRFASYLEYVRTGVAAARAAGRTREQAMEEVDLTPYAHLGEFGDFLTRKNNVGWVYDELSRK